MSWIHVVLSLEHIAHLLLCESDAVGGHRLVYFCIYPRAFPVSKREREKERKNAFELSMPKTINCHVAAAQRNVLLHRKAVLYEQIKAAGVPFLLLAATSPLWFSGR